MNPVFARIGATTLEQDFARLNAQIDQLIETRNKMIQQGTSVTDPTTFNSIVADITSKATQRKALMTRIDMNSANVVEAPTPDAWISTWQALLTNYQRLQRFKPQNPLNPGANPLVTGFLDEATKAATAQFQKDFGYPVDGVPKFEYADVLNGLKPGPRATGSATTATTGPTDGTTNPDGTPAVGAEKSKAVQALTVAGLLSPIALVWWLTR